jgi:hypothetical protein
MARPSIQPPKLTEAGIRALRHQLDVDLADVAATCTDLPTIKSLIVDTLDPRLDMFADDMHQDMPTDVAWVTVIAPYMLKLTPLLVKALGLTKSDEGACTYTNSQGGVDCIVCTSAQCIQLGGSFNAGYDCSGNPLP